MMIVSRLLGIVAAGILAVGLSTAAHAVTVIDDGDVVNLPIGSSEYVGDIKGTPASGSYAWQVTFNAPNAGSAGALVTLSSVVAGTFRDLRLSWLDASDNSVLASVAITPIVTTLGTIFDTVRSQILSISWSADANDPRIGFDVTVDANIIPLPLGGLLLLSGLGGLAILGRRRTAA